MKTSLSTNPSSSRESAGELESENVVSDARRVVNEVLSSTIMSAKSLSELQGICENQGWKLIVERGPDGNCNYIEFQTGDSSWNSTFTNSVKGRSPADFDIALTQYLLSTSFFEYFGAPGYRLFLQISDKEFIRRESIRKNSQGILGGGGGGSGGGGDSGSGGSEKKAPIVLTTEQKERQARWKNALMKLNGVK